MPTGGSFRVEGRNDADKAHQPYPPARAVVGAPAAIANALTDTLSPLGIEIFELPMTHERLFRLVDRVKASAYSGADTRTPSLSTQTGSSTRASSIGR
jgi:hypothetical protein